MTLSEQIDEILFDMNSGELIVTHKYTPELYKLAINKALGYELISPKGNTYKLERNGYKAVNLGSFEKWLVYDEQKKTAGTINTQNFHGPVTGSMVNQDSSSRDLNTNQSTTTGIPAENDHKQKAKTSFIGTWVAPIIVTIAGGVIMYFFPELIKFIKGK